MTIRAIMLNVIDSFLEFIGVYRKGQATASTSSSTSVVAEPIAVAIKVLKRDQTPEAEADFEKEIEILSNFKHNNIVKLLGVIRNCKHKIRPNCTQSYHHGFIIL